MDFPWLSRTSDLVTIRSFSGNIPDGPFATPERAAHCAAPGSNHGSPAFEANAFDLLLWQPYGIRIWGKISAAADSGDPK